jgi:hypothetical protein
LDWDPEDRDVDDEYGNLHYPIPSARKNTNSNYFVFFSDIEAVIQRCNDRISDGIMPQWWTQKLEDYQKLKKENDAQIASVGPPSQRNQASSFLFISSILTRLLAFRNQAST